MNTQDDVALLQAWREGDGHAGDALVTRHYKSVLRFFELRTRAAEDLTQRTFLACVEGRDRIQLANGFRAYLLESPATSFFSTSPTRSAWRVWRASTRSRLQRARA